MRPLSTPAVRPFLAACALALAVGAAFWIPALAGARGYFPAPLDDVYIHFDFARSLASGRPFEWLPGNGYSSGETAPLYAAVLAVGWLFGFRGAGIGVFAALVAVLGVASFLRSVQRLIRPCPAPLTWLVAALLLSIGLLDWTLFSGMEVALFAAVLGHALEALARARAPLDERGGLTRESAQWRLGLRAGALVLLRPEAGVLVAIFAVVGARGAGPRSGLGALARVGLPGALATTLVLGANRLFTGEAQSAGALLKLLPSQPYFTDVDRARVFVENLVTFALKGVRTELGTIPTVGLGLLAALALVPRRRRPVAAASVLGALAWVLVVSLNNNSPHHNFRYYAPAFLLMLAAAASGAAALADALPRRHGARISGAVVAVIGIAAALHVPLQVKHFARAAGNIRDQQIEIGRMLAERMAPGERVLLGDAGAIPFVSGRPALDALGLGGYHGLPFARAAVNGEAATVELIERLPAAERPAYLALYPNWFGLITSRFGVEVARVTLVDNVICAGATKVIYRADWSALDVPRAPADGVLDELDVADVISEREHAYASPAPAGGWTTLDILTDAAEARRFDGGRIIPGGASESFVLGPRVTGDAPLRIAVRVAGGAKGPRLRTATEVVELDLDPASPGRWTEARGVFRGRSGERVTLEAPAGGHRDYHVWISR
ncbi:MAG TPA: hypothetical protein VLT33_20790 [Labilithrix sp.]|nr:hypothetical protein [Labilithrix sp.]